MARDAEKRSNANRMATVLNFIFLHCKMGLLSPASVRSLKAASICSIHMQMWEGDKEAAGRRRRLHTLAAKTKAGREDVWCCGHTVK